MYVRCMFVCEHDDLIYVLFLVVPLDGRFAQNAQFKTFKSHSMRTCVSFVTFATFAYVIICCFSLFMYYTYNLMCVCVVPNGTLS